jgi:hypothetical protein
MQTTTGRAISLSTPDRGKTVHVTLTGKLEVEDYETFVPYLEEWMEKNDEVDLLVDLVDFHGWTAGAAWEDTKFAARHFSDIRRLAIVGDSKWEKGMAIFCKPFTRAKVRYFDRSDRDEATRWIGK